MAREQFSSRLGFLLISAGCAIGLGNVWRFPYVAGQYGGAIFVLIYLAMMFAIGVPLMTMELSIGRASRQSLGKSFETLKPGSKWYLNKFWMIPGNYVLMGFYSLVTGWMFYYTILVGSGSVDVGIEQAQAGAIFNDLLASPNTMLICMLVVVIGSFAVCAFGLEKGVERINKPMMLLLFALLIFLSLRSIWLPGFAEGVSYYLMPNYEQVKEHGILNVLSAALGQCFFALGLGVGSIQIFGSYMKRNNTLTNEAFTITFLDALVAVLAGFVVFPACFSYGVEPGSGPGLVFVTLVTVFSNMAYGSIWGGIFFLFMLFAAVSTLIAVFENIIAISMEVFNISRLKSVLFNFIVVVLLCLPCLYGYNYLSDIHPLGGSSTILDLEDFIISNNILPFGALIYTAFITWRGGWGWKNFLSECNTGRGVKMPSWGLNYYRFVVPVVIFLLIVNCYYAIFAN